jgi:hypothetical protein
MNLICQEITNGDSVRLFSRHGTISLCDLFFANAITGAAPTHGDVKLSVAQALEKIWTVE